MRCFGGAPEYERSLDISVAEVWVDIPEGFERQSIIPALRYKHVRMINIYLKHAHKIWTKGEGININISDIPDHEKVWVHI